MAGSLVALVPGCMHYQPAPLHPNASAARLTSRHLAAKTWTLRSLTNEALQHHPEIAVARAKYETAVAAVRTAGERPNPTVTLLPQLAPIRAIEGTYSVDFDWTLETGGKRSKRILTARAQAEAAAANVIDTIWKVRGAVRKAFVEMYAADQRVKLAHEAIARQEELLRAYDERVKAGAESRSATQQARLLQAQMRLQAAESEKLAAVARAALAEALAMSVHGLEGASFSFVSFESPPHPATGRRQALTHRADVLAALADYAAAEGSLRLEVAKQYPDIHLNPGYALDSGVNKWALGLGLSLPILSQNRGPIAEAEAKRREAAAVFESVQAKVLAECDRATASLAAAQKKLATTDALLAEQDRQTAEDERLLKAGNGERSSLLSAKVERAITQTARVDALAEVHAALGALEEATQTPLAE